jgi:hypothetical protein
MDCVFSNLLLIEKNALSERNRLPLKCLAVLPMESDVLHLVRGILVKFSIESNEIIWQRIRSHFFCLVIRLISIPLFTTLIDEKK